MAEFGAPCLDCGNELRNVQADCDNQPEGGTAFKTYGHYGSTEFDPEDGQYLEINICTRCLARAYHQGRILWGRAHRIVMCDRIVVGWEPVDRPLVPWNGDGNPEEDQVLHLSVEELERYPKIEWFEPGVQAARNRNRS